MRIDIESSHPILFSFYTHEDGVQVESFPDREMAGRQLGWLFYNIVFDWFDLAFVGERSESKPTSAGDRDQWLPHKEMASNAGARDLLDYVVRKLEESDEVEVVFLSDVTDTVAPTEDDGDGDSTYNFHEDCRSWIDYSTRVAMALEGMGHKRCEVAS